VAKVSRNILGIAVFFSALGFGMHVAGQTPPPMPSAGDIQNLQKMVSGASGGAIPMVPAFGPAAVQQAESLDDGAAQAPVKKSGPVKKDFVASVVETVSPNQVKIGDPRAVLHTAMGDITIRLFSNYAPKTVHNFIDLARGDREFLDAHTGKSTRRPFYNDMIFHRVVSGFLIQTGCPFGTGRGGPGFTIPDEIAPMLKFDKPGMVAA